MLKQVHYNKAGLGTSSADSKCTLVSAVWILLGLFAIIAFFKGAIYSSVIGGVEAFCRYVQDSAGGLLYQLFWISSACVALYGFVVLGWFRIMTRITNVLLFIVLHEYVESIASIGLVRSLHDTMYTMLIPFYEAGCIMFTALFNIVFPLCDLVFFLIILHQPDVVHGGHPQRVVAVTGHLEACQALLDPRRRGQGVPVSDQQQPPGKSILPQNLSDLGHQAAADADVMDAAPVVHAAAAVPERVNQRAKIQHFVQSFPPIAGFVSLYHSISRRAGQAVISNFGGFSADFRHGLQVSFHEYANQSVISCRNSVKNFGFEICENIY